MVDMASLVADLEHETAALRSLVEPLDANGWATPTPSEPWTILDQIGHLAYFDEQAVRAVTDPGLFAEHVNRSVGSLGGDVATLHRERGLAGPETLEWWTGARRSMLDALVDIDPDHRLPWYGPPMRASSFAIARLMETWAHGTDVADGLATSLPVTDRLFHVADLGVRTFSWSFSNRGLDVPEERVRVVLRGPSGAIRTWNDGSPSSVTGPVEDFCLVVTQRRRVSDTSLVTEGETAGRWMEVAQAFAGPPGPGR